MLLIWIIFFKKTHTKKTISICLRSDVNVLISLLLYGNTVIIEIYSVLLASVTLILAHCHKSGEEKLALSNFSKSFYLVKFGIVFKHFGLKTGVVFDMLTSDQEK